MQAQIWEMKLLSAIILMTPTKELCNFQKKWLNLFVLWFSVNPHANRPSLGICREDYMR